MQIHGMQCSHTNGIEKYFRLINENGYEIKDEAHGKKEKIKFLQLNLIMRL